jgi:murein DD-endopeptidase MepM/ murein hydrolase activator NlpD
MTATVPVLYYVCPSRRKYAIVDSFNRIYIPGTTRKYARGKHGGIDVGGTLGLLLAGTVAGITRNPHFGSAYGNQISIVRSGGSGAFLAHLRYAVKTGVNHTATSGIAQMDTTGQVTGCHCHYEWHPVWYDWRNILNPYAQLEAARRRLLAVPRAGAPRELERKIRKLTLVPTREIFELHEAAEGPTKDDVDLMLEENHDWFDKADKWHRDNVRTIRRKARAAA